MLIKKLFTVSLSLQFQTSKFHEELLWKTPDTPQAMEYRFFQPGAVPLVAPGLRITPPASPKLESITCTIRFLPIWEVFGFFGGVFCSILSGCYSTGFSRSSGIWNDAWFIPIYVFLCLRFTVLVSFSVCAWLLNYSDRVWICHYLSIFQHILSRKGMEWNSRNALPRSDGFFLEALTAFDSPS